MTVPGWSTTTAQSWSPAEDQYLLELLARGGPERRCVGPPLADLMAERFRRPYNHQQIWLRLTQICPATSQSKLPPQFEPSVPKRISNLEEIAIEALKKPSTIDLITSVDSQPRERSESESKGKRNSARSGPPPPRGGTKWRQEEMAALVEFVDSQGKDWATIADLMTSRFGTRYRRYSHFTVEFKWRYMKRLQPAQFARSSKPSSESEECDLAVARPRCHSESDIPPKKPRTMAAVQPVASHWGEIISSARLETVDHFVNRIFATGGDEHFVIEH